MPVSLLASSFNFRKQPAGATAKRTKLAPSFNYQERIAIARPETLQRLQLRIGSLTRTSPLPKHTGQASGIGLPSQNPQVFGE